MLSNLSRQQQIALVAVAAVVLALIGHRTLIKHGGETLPLETISPAVLNTDKIIAEQDNTICLVHVCGAVLRPGDYRLSKGSRVYQAIETAGGATGWADTSALNMAAPVHDGQRIEIPVRGTGASAQSSGKGALSNGPVDLNTADEEQLDTLPGVGPATARKIIEYRDKNGSFRHTDDLMKIPGIGRKKYDKLKDHVCIN
ncbi:MAG: helix-hairpin-helix domain-containing protein [bacterium]|nr:helix-hairpin-helix domain-containing protein [bacterium]